MPDCLFCRVASGQIPATILAEDDLTLTFADVSPVAPTHVLIIPRQHFANVTEAPAELLGHLVHTAAGYGKENLPNGFRVVLNTGNDGGQTVEHLHLHILGERPMHWPPG